MDVENPAPLAGEAVMFIATVTMPDGGFELTQTCVSLHFEGLAPDDDGTSFPCAGKSASDLSSTWTALPTPPGTLARLTAPSGPRTW